MLHEVMSMFYRATQALKFFLERRKLNFDDREFVRGFRTDSFLSLSARLESRKNARCQVSIYAYKVACSHLMRNKTCMVKSVLMEELLPRCEALLSNDFLCEVLHIAVNESNLSLISNTLDQLTVPLSGRNKSTLAQLLGTRHLSFGAKEKMLDLLNVPTFSIKQHLKNEKNPNMVRAIMEVHHITAHYLECYIQEAKRNRYPVYVNLQSRQAMLEALGRARYQACP